MNTHDYFFILKRVIFFLVFSVIFPFTELSISPILVFFSATLRLSSVTRYNALACLGRHWVLDLPERPSLLFFPLSCAWQRIIRYK